MTSKIYKTGKPLPLFLSCLAMLVVLMMGAHAATVTNITAQLRPGVSISVDGTWRNFYNVSGQEVHPIFYSGTHYLPVRAIGELMGKNVNWDQSTLTVTLSGTRTTPAVTGTPDPATAEQNITAQLRADFTIIVDSVTRNFFDAQGNAVYPLLYQGSTYLPVRAIGQLMGKNVSWDSVSMIITLSGSSLVTDADSFNGTSSTPSANIAPSAPATGTNTATGGLISAEAAKSKALAHAGLTANQVTFVRSQMDWENGRQVYEVEFYTNNKEYDYEIDALTGAVVSFDYDAEYYTYTPPVTNTGNTGNTSNTGSSNSSYIGEAKAKQLALKHAGKTANQVSFTRAYLDWDDGRAQYDVKFISGTLEYDFEIDAISGRIFEYDVDSIYD